MGDAAVIRAWPRRSGFYSRDQVLARLEALGYVGVDGPYAADGYFGFPPGLAYLIDAVHERLPLGEAAAGTPRILGAIAQDADLSGVIRQFLIRLNRRNWERLGDAGGDAVVALCRAAVAAVVVGIEAGVAVDDTGLEADALPCRPTPAERAILVPVREARSALQWDLRRPPVTVESQALYAASRSSALLRSPTSTRAPLAMRQILGASSLAAGLWAEASGRDPSATRTAERRRQADDLAALCLAASRAPSKSEELGA